MRYGWWKEVDHSHPIPRDQHMVSIKAAQGSGYGGTNCWHFWLLNVAKRPIHGKPHCLKTGSNRLRSITHSVGSVSLGHNRPCAWILHWPGCGLKWWQSFSGHRTSVIWSWDMSTWMNLSHLPAWCKTPLLSCHSSSRPIFCVIVQESLDGTDDCLELENIDVVYLLCRSPTAADAVTSKLHSPSVQRSIRVQG